MPTVIAYGPPSENLPAVPETVVVQADEILLVRRDRRKAISQEKLDSFLEGEHLAPVQPEELRDGLWMSVEPGGTLSWFPLLEEKKWRASRAEQLLLQAVDLKDPEERLSVLHAAAGMCGIDLPVFMGQLELARKSPGESLTDIFSRMRK